MNHPKSRTLISFWLIVCLLLSFLPLGCHSGQARHPVADDGRHHHQDGKTMQLIKRDVHKDFFHTGGMANTRK